MSPSDLFYWIFSELAPETYPTLYPGQSSEQLGYEPVAENGLSARRKLRQAKWTGASAEPKDDFRFLVEPDFVGAFLIRLQAPPSSSRPTLIPKTAHSVFLSQVEIVIQSYYMFGPNGRD